jgi:hypothetical protein
MIILLQVYTVFPRIYGRILDFISNYINALIYYMSKSPKKNYISAKYQRTRRNYTYKKKQEILKKFDQSGESIVVFAKNINIPVRTLRNWNNKRFPNIQCEKWGFKDRKNGIW